RLKLVTNGQDIVEHLQHPNREKSVAPLVAKMQARPEPQLDGAEAKVWRALSLQEAVSIDALLSKLPLSTSEVYSALLALEMAEHIRQLPGKKYIRRL